MQSCNMRQHLLATLINSNDLEISSTACRQIPVLAPDIDMHD